MTQGDIGPYQNDDGDVWVPRTVPYIEARKVAKSGFYEDGRDRLVYVGKSSTQMLGFVRECRCDEVCELELHCGTCDHDHDGLSSCYREDCECVRFNDSNDGTCKAPAWHFRLEEAR